MSTETSIAAKRSYHPASKPKSPRADPSKAIAMLRDFIEAGGYSAGMALPAERVLAEKLGVGRPAIREAIKALSILDVIESRRGAGTFIKSLEGLRVGWPTSVELRSSDFTLLDLLEVRKMFEPAAARLAAMRANESSLRRIASVCSQIEDAADWEAMALHDLALHNAIIAAAGNPVLIELNNAIARLQRKSREVTGASAPNREAMLSNHRHIVDAILRGEGENAERAMLEHLHQVGLDLISNRKR
jgi:GntR family transcriptional regulator, transcriptional repressor for pyruvate dehydrogenase complex